MLIPSLFAVTLVLTGGLLIGLHQRSWRCAQAQDLSDEERQFVFGQYRRRMQTSAMIALVGILVFIGQSITSGLLVLFYWLAVVLIVFWIMLLAIADMLATRVHFSRMRKDELIQQVRLQADLNRAKADQEAATREQCNGKHDQPPKPDG